MNIENVQAICFSPTGTSKKVVRAIAEGCNGGAVVETDVTLPGAPSCGSLGANDLAVIGVPVYAGRVAPLAAERIQGLSGNDTPAVIVVLYGNREFEDALIELRDIVVAKGFSVVGAAAFIGEHSFSTSELPIAAGRPDADDTAKAREFGRAVMEKIAAQPAGAATVVDVPGNVPYKDGVGNFPFVPIVDDTACVKCGTCVENCPTGSVVLDDAVAITVETCILCAACVKGCPEDALSLKTTPIQEKRVAMSENLKARKEPQIFM